MSRLPVYLAGTAMAVLIGCCGLAMVPGLAMYHEQLASCLAPGDGEDFNKSDQQANARTIVEVGVKLHVPRRAIVIAVAAAMTESSLVNMSGGDRDSAGLFQMRPSMGWGSHAQVTDPVYASAKFYAVLLTVPNWQNLPLTVAAQRVERSGRPNAYAKFEAAAEAMVAKLLGGASPAPSASVQPALDPGGIPLDCAGGGGGGGAGDVPLPKDFTLPPGTPRAIVTAISWALAQRGTSYHYGGSCTDPHSSDITKHCDCSSLMQMAYRAAGISIGRSTYDQIRLPMRVPSVGQLLPGDLIFADDSASAPGHVGMYLGRGLLVQAPHTGDVVKVSTVASWSRRIVAFRRVVPAGVF